MHRVKLMLYTSIPIIYALWYIKNTMCSQSDRFIKASVFHVSKSSDTLRRETCASSFIREQLAFSYTTSGFDAN